ncbi:hypothetical protein [Arthrobacter sp. A2-55]|uniref:hypothetical protein n=1 Tax=Arthrobacter sp. A2-55 TaxID=2897337 RepID=UPI0021CD6362|nr:hypothetical protein [Arthrobacter sp. A2-55]MCU6481408.1 hypothetical protein [Arthrobacter sp. A2-55]
MSHNSGPLVSLAQLHRLEESLGGDAAACHGVVSTYVNMWGTRYRRLSSTILADDLEGAMDSALSVFSSSHMVGAERLEHRAEQVIEALRRKDLDQAARALPALGKCGDLTVADLRVGYLAGRPALHEAGSPGAAHTRKK